MYECQTCSSMLFWSNTFFTMNRWWWTAEQPCLERDLFKRDFLYITHLPTTCIPSLFSFYIFLTCSCSFYLSAHGVITDLLNYKSCCLKRIYGGPKGQNPRKQKNPFKKLVMLKLLSTQSEKTKIIKQNTASWKKCTTTIVLFFPIYNLFF